MLKKILIVDDSRVFHGAYMLYLKKYNCNFAHAMNGQEALDILHVQTDIDLIMLDINMPIMNGLQFLEKATARGIPSRIPIIVASSEGTEQDVVKGLKLGARGYLKKPFNPPEMHQLIDKIFNRLCSF